MTRQLAFTKMHGLGNDIVVVDGRTASVVIDAQAARAIADRRRGVGFDQLMVIEPARDGGDAYLRILNSDGSEAQACGNGTRCVAALLMEETGRRRLDLETVAGHLEARREADGRVTVDMGEARLGWRDIPVIEPCDTLRLPIAIGGLDAPVGVSMGNPHCVFFLPDAEAAPVLSVGPTIERHGFFPERTNVEFASVTGPDRLRLRVWERGVGVTQACGSGTCAAAVAAHRRGLTGRRVTVDVDGGTLEIHWREPDGHVEMTGPATLSFRGTVDLEALVAGYAPPRRETAA